MNGRPSVLCWLSNEEKTNRSHSCSSSSLSFVRPCRYVARPLITFQNSEGKKKREIVQTRCPTRWWWWWPGGWQLAEQQWLTNDKEKLTRPVLGRRRLVAFCWLDKFCALAQKTPTAIKMTEFCLKQGGLFCTAEKGKKVWENAQKYICNVVSSFLDFPVGSCARIIRPA